MAKPFDATLKELVDAYPADWLAQCGLPTSSPTDLIEADLSTITTAADKVIRVRDQVPWLVHVELQASRDDTLPRRLLKYYVLLLDRHQLPVHSIVVLLRESADTTELTGNYAYQSPGGTGRTELRFQVVRVWEHPVEALLAGGLGTLPLVPLGRVTPDKLPAAIAGMEERLRDAQPDQQATLWTATYILMGLRYPDEFAAQLLRGVRAMKESVTYQAILKEGEIKGRIKGEIEGEIKGKIKGEIEGEIKEARKLLLRLGQKRFGGPGADVQTAIAVITEVDRLERLIERVQEVADWSELLATP